VLRKHAALPALILAMGLLFVACSKTLNVSDLAIESDLKQVGETQTGQTVTDVSCPDQIDDPKDGTTFECELTLEDDSKLTAKLELKETDGKFQATLQGLE
jgi:hypothetical protein